MSKIIGTETVSNSHPDKMADIICDFVLAYEYEEDMYFRSSINACIYYDMGSLMVVLTGFIKNKKGEQAQPYDKILEHFLIDVFFIDNKVTVIDNISYQKREGAIQPEGGFVIGYSDSSTSNNMPLGCYISRDLNLYAMSLFSMEELAKRPIIRNRVVLETDEDVKRFHTLDFGVLSEANKLSNIEERVEEELRSKVESDYSNYFDDNTEINFSFIEREHERYMNGMSGRKLVNDLYGPYCMINGGSLSGKDMGSIDRGGAYLARYIANNLSNIGKFDKSEVYLTYSDKYYEPISIYCRVYMYGEKEILFELPDYFYDKIKEEFPVDIREMKEFFNQENYFDELETSSYHFKNTFPWEQLDKVESLKNVSI